MIVLCITRCLALCSVVVLFAGCTVLPTVLPKKASVEIVPKQQVPLVGKAHRDTLISGGQSPEVMLVPAGQFMMGSPEDEPGRYANESPQHYVNIAQSFLLGLTEVTVAQFRQFVQATDYQTDGERDSGSFFRDASAEKGRWRLSQHMNWRLDHEGNPSLDDNPVVHVSWNDAQTYLAWLSEETGKHYRLPSEAELEYVNRAGSTGLYWWGEGSPVEKLANIRGDKDKSVANPLTWEHTELELNHALADGDVPLAFVNYGDGHHGVAPVGTFGRNSFGLYDTTGNVWEWAEDCWHDNYNDAPRDGSAWVEDNSCEYRVVRGGSFYCFPRHVRSANRWRQWPDFRNMFIGFRIARDL